MVNKKKLKEPVLISFQVEKDVLDEFNNKVANKSEALRNFVEKYVDNSGDDLKILRLKMLEKQKKIDELNMEIEELADRIFEIKQERANNKNKREIIDNAMDTIYRKIKSESGVTEDEVETIANMNNLSPLDLKKECKKHNIKFVSVSKKAKNDEGKSAKSKLVPLEEEIERTSEDELKRIVLRIHRKTNSYNNANNYKKISTLDYFNQNIEEIKRQCERASINIDEVRERMNDKK